MKAARLHNYDESIPPESLKVEEIDEPKIESPLDVIVRIGAAGLCRTDIHIIEGQWAPIQDPDRTLLPYTLGHENAGWVEEVGSGVTNVSVGDTVILHPLMTCGAVQGVPRRGRHVLRERRVPRPLPRWWLRRSPEDQRPRGREA
jgi:NAD+-dependent secondary alcohol dehydrogenase Adh1